MVAVASRDDRRHYLRLTLKEQNRECVTPVTGAQGLGILLSMVRAQGLAIDHGGMNHQPASSRVLVLLLD